MTPLASLSLRYDGHRVHLLDQTLLPDEERWIDATAPSAMVEAIQALRVRGAPLIGVAAALCLGLHEGDPGVAALLRSARPTAVNLMAAVDLVAAAARPREAAERLFADDVARCAGMAAHGAALLEDGEGLLTHCNTGSLATAGVGTALGAIRQAAAEGKRLHVYVDETRPLLQGARLTAWELGRLGIPYTLVTDSMAALLLRDGHARRVLVGADRIARNGDFANKVGTYGLAVAARFHGAPFHVVAPWTTVDVRCADGAAIPVEERDPAEVRGARGSFGAVRWAPAGAPAFNPAFDVTPAALVTSLVLDDRVVPGSALASGAWARGDRTGNS